MNSGWLHRQLSIGSAFLALVFLAACGGGGTSSTPPPAQSPSPTPSPTPSPSPTPTPTPTPGSYTPPPLPNDTTGYYTSEFRISDGPRFHGAPSAWVGGNTGTGVTIGIIDSGIDTDSPEFAGRIADASVDVAGSRTIEAISSHGTRVAMVAAAAADGVGVVGIAPGATILAIRADEPGSCTAGGPTSAASTCDFFDPDIAVGIDHAVANGAKVINLSLGGDGAASVVLSAISRASDAGVVIVVAAGNGGLSQPTDFAQLVLNAGNGNVIIAGSVDSAGELSDFSNGAQGSADFYLAALGESICCVYEDGAIFVDGDGASYLFSGTSFATPQITGAVALLAQAFPSLTGAQIVEILLNSAQDVGDLGADDVFGQGILNIAQAFAPQGNTSLAGLEVTPLPLGDNTLIASPAMGDAITTASIETVILDKYGRAYNLDLASRMRGAQISNRLNDAIGGESRFVAFGNETASLAFTIDASGRASGSHAVSPLHLSQGDAEAARVLAARVALKLSPETQLGFTYAQGADGLVAQLQGQARPAFLIAQSAGGDDGTFRSTDVSLALRHRIGNWGFTISGESGQTVSAAPVQLAEFGAARRQRDVVRGFGFAVDRNWRALEAQIGLNWLSEDRTVLGARFHGALGGGGAETMFFDANAGWSFAENWRLGGALRNGWTFADQNNVISAGSQLYSRAWSFDIQRSNAFGTSGSMGLRVSQPLRVESGGINLNLPVAYSYDTQSATNGVRTLALSPQGREIMGEVSLHGQMWNGSAMLSLFYRREPGHYSAVPDDKGMALRWSGKF